MQLVHVCGAPRKKRVYTFNALAVDHAEYSSSFFQDELPLRILLQP
jgi:hypothetical protein